LTHVALEPRGRDPDCATGRHDTRAEDELSTAPSGANGGLAGCRFEAKRSSPPDAKIGRRGDCLQTQAVTMISAAEIAKRRDERVGDTHMTGRRP